jgi:TPR repeat protein
MPGRRSEAMAAYELGEERWAAGDVRSAFRLVRRAAEQGIEPAIGLLGYFYDDGIGTRADRDAALYWYGRAYRRGSFSAANNIGVIWRDRGRRRRALAWFARAVALGDVDANLNIAKMYLTDGDRERAAKHLRATCETPGALEGSVDEARRLLRELARTTTRHAGAPAGTPRATTSSRPRPRGGCAGPSPRTRAR